MNTSAITVKLPISLKSLAHLLGRCTFPEAALAMLKDDPTEAEIIINRLARNYFSSLNTDVLIRSVQFSHVDSQYIPDSTAYFSASLVGTRDELSKVVDLAAEPAAHVTK